MVAGLSDLPAEVIIAILSILPVVESVRTSILSRSWRHHWWSIPDLTFNLEDDLDIAAVDHVLGLHSAPIQSFSLSIGGYKLNPKDLDRWLAALSADPLPLRSLTLDVWGPHMPAFSHRLSFSNLNHLRLRGCPLPTYCYDRFGFPVLETLHLSGCILPDCDGLGFSDLIIDCPLLQKLTLLDMECCYLRICAPNLHFFVFRGKLDSFALAGVSLLTTVEIHLPDFYDNDDDDDDKLNECNLIKAFGDARNIEKLNLFGYSLYFLGNSGIPDRIPDTFERLKVLTFTADFNIAKEILVLLCSLRSAPNLHGIKIEGLEYSQEIWGLGHEFWQAQNHLELPKLQTLELTHIMCVEPMLGFIDYILPKAPELEKMEINVSAGSKKYGSIAKLSNSKELVRHWRASTRAQIIFTGEFLCDCAITSSRSDAALSLWVESNEQTKIKELQEILQSRSQEIEEMMQMQQQIQQTMQKQQMMETMPSQFASQQQTSYHQYPMQGFFYPPPVQPPPSPPPPQASQEYQMNMCREEYEEFQRYLASRMSNDTGGARGAGGCNC